VEDVLEAVARLQREGLTILLVEQNVGVALRAASTALVLRDGQVALEGRTEELVDNPDVVRAYLGG
jgi:branched-chain amino acid transport system ATP-binding protein